MALASPAQKDGFFYAGDALYCEASNLSRHRRATLVELKAHFAGKGTDKDHPAHWYEAQLLHYGLPPSKVKGTAHKRLFDAVTRGGLTVPSHIQKLEADLKKEWNKREREAKKMVKESAAAQPKAKSVAKKRKADQVSASTNVSVHVSVQVSSTGQILKQATTPPAAKKTKTNPTTKAAATRKAPKTTTPKAAPKATAPKKAATSRTTPKTITKVASKVAPTAIPLTKASKPTAKGKVMPTQTARRSNPPGSGPAASFATGGTSFDSAHHYPYAEFEPSHGSSSQAYHLSSPDQPKLGLLNGRYTVRSCDLDDEFGDVYNTDFGFIATLDNRRLWLKFDFGAVVGIMELDRPYGVTDGKLHTTWRGDAPNKYGGLVFIDQRTDGDNWVEFLGDGHVQGSISWDGYKAYRFEAERLPGQPGRSEISPPEMRRLYEDHDRPGWF